MSSDIDPTPAFSRSANIFGCLDDSLDFRINGDMKIELFKKAASAFMTPDERKAWREELAAKAEPVKKSRGTRPQRSKAEQALIDARKANK